MESEESTCTEVRIAEMRMKIWVCGSNEKYGIHEKLGVGSLEDKKEKRHRWNRHIQRRHVDAQIRIHKDRDRISENFGWENKRISRCY